MLKAKRKVLLLAPIHDWNAYFLQCAQELESHGRILSTFPKWQAHQGWLKALQQMDVDLKTFVYTHSLLINPDSLSAFRNILPTAAAHARGASTWRYILDLQSQKGWDRPFRKASLLRVVDDFQPDVVLISGGTGLNSLGFDVFKTIKERYPTIRYILFNGISPHDSATELEKQLLALVECVVTNDEGHSEGWRLLGAKDSIALPISAIDPDIFNDIKVSNEERKRLGSDICFVGTFKPVDRYTDRVDAVRALSKLDLAIWTNDYDVIAQYPELKKKFRGNASGETLIKIYKSCRIALNIHGHYMPKGANLRTFEIPATGCLQMIDHTLPDLFQKDRECVFFDNANDLQGKTKALLDNEPRRLEIANAGSQRTYRDHTYLKRFERLFDLLKLA